MTKEQIKLHSDRAQRFRRIRDDLSEKLDYQPSKAETIGLVMACYDLDQDRSADELLGGL
jgi:hypothetical protein